MLKRSPRLLTGLMAALVASSGVALAQPRLAPRAPSSQPTEQQQQPALAPATSPITADALWQPVANKADLGQASVSVRKGYSRAFTLDERKMEETLASAPLEETEASQAKAVVMTLPMPNGSLERFRVVESPIMESALAAEFPLIRTYRGQGLDDPTATARVDMTPLGFHGQVLSAGATVYVDPYSPNQPGTYITYDKGGLRLGGREFHCLVDETASALADDANKLSAYSNGGTLRTYRLALACTGEYATAVCNHNGVAVTVANTFSAMTTTMNRVNGVYEREVSVHMNLVANDTSIVYTDANTDPYTNTNANSLLTQNQSTCDSKIGSGSYDIGHVFSTGGGGLAGLGVVCGSRKAQGETGSSAPYGDGYDIDYVAHEMGHEFGGDHTFISSAGNCSGNGNASTAYERGSGSTIQAYAGICSTDDLQPHSDDYFHSISLNEITAYIAGGGACSVNTSTGNSIPTLPALTSYTGVPVGTTFTLTAPTATDANGDTLTYCWEDWQTGSACDFRPKAPTTSRSRTFSNVANPTSGNIAWEVLPTTAKTKTFRCTVRDNRSGGGAFTSATMTVAFVAGAFSVTAPNTAVSWAGNSTQTVTWAKGGSTAANVKISLSTDGGTNWSTVVASTANDGSEAITVPNTPSTTARIKVEPTDNVYFDVSNVNFTITSGGTQTPDMAVSASPSSVSVAQGASGSSTVSTTVSGGFNSAVSLSVAGVPSGASASFSPASIAAPGGGSSTLSIAAGTAAAGNYTLTVTASGGGLTRTATIGLTITTTGGCSSSTTAIASGGSLTGALATNDCTITAGNGSAGGYYDQFTFSATAGQTATITLNSTAFDAYLRLYNPSNAQVATDDDSNGGTNSKLTYTIPTSGLYIVRATSYAVGSTGSYTIGLTLSGGGGTETLACGASVAGTLSTTDATITAPGGGTARYDSYTLNLTAGSQVTITMNSTAFDAYLRLYNAAGTQVASNDDGNGGTNSKIVYTATASGTYTLRATSYYSGSTGSYTVARTCP